MKNLEADYPPRIQYFKEMDSCDFGDEVFATDSLRELVITEEYFTFYYVRSGAGHVCIFKMSWFIS